MKSALCMTLREYEPVYGQPCQHPASQLVGKVVGGRPITPAPMMKPLATSPPSDNWFNCCEYSSQPCAKALYSVAGLPIHLKEAHNMDKFEYFKQFGGNGIKIRKYKCKISGKNFLWSSVSISKHVKQDYDMSLPEYTVRFEKHANMISTQISGQANDTASKKNLAPVIPFDGLEMEKEVKVIPRDDPYVKDRGKENIIDEMCTKACSPYKCILVSLNRFMLTVNLKSFSTEQMRLRPPEL